MEAPASDRVKMPSERMLIFLIGAVQFVNTLDFIIVMPLGPDFAQALDIPTSHIGFLGGSYTAAAAVSGVLCSLFLDRFDRRIALACAMLGLVIGTAAGGFATGSTTLFAARVLAGTFGGPATALSYAIIADVIPPGRRGRAMGAIMGAFSIASVLGVPAGLELARVGGWRLPFFAVAALGLVIAATAIFALPSLRLHLSRGPATSVQAPLLTPVTMLSLAMSATVMIGVFAVVPNLSAYFQHNMGYPREKLGLLYLVGGAASFVAMRLIGPLVDRFGATRMIAFGTFLHCAVLAVCFVHPVARLPVLLLFVGFMVSGSVRMVPLGTLATRVPEPHQRARFMSAQSAIQHTASSIGAIGASLLLSASPTGELIGMNNVGLVALVLAMMVPFLSHLLEARLLSRESASAQGAIV